MPIYRKSEKGTAYSEKALFYISFSVSYFPVFQHMLCFLASLFIVEYSCRMHACRFISVMFLAAMVHNLLQHVPATGLTANGKYRKIHINYAGKKS